MINLIDIINEAENVKSLRGMNAAKLYVGCDTNIILVEYELELNGRTCGVTRSFNVGMLLTTELDYIEIISDGCHKILRNLERLT